MPRYQIAIAAAVLLLDRLTKLVVVKSLALEQTVTVVPGFFQITHLENSGAAFSMFADSASAWAPVLLVCVSVAAAVIISVLLWRRGPKLDDTSVCLSLILGGTLGNLWDRLLFAKVTDFLDFYLGVHHWPPFNVADSAIVVGALWLAMRGIFGGDSKRKRAA